MSEQATGTFDVRLAPATAAHEGAVYSVSRMTIDKDFHGDLEAHSLGEMLAVRSAIDGSAGYVALEEVTGTLAGRAGTFVLQHSSSMARGVPRQSITVVPDSGTGELVGLAGTMVIIVTAGAHSYEMDYTIDRVD